MPLPTARRRSVALVGVLLVAAVLMVTFQRPVKTATAAAVVLGPGELSGAAAVVDDPAAWSAICAVAGPSLGRGALPRHRGEARHRSPGGVA